MGSPDVSASFLDGGGVADDTDTGFVFTKALDVPIQIGVANVVVEHSNRDIEIAVLVLAIGIVLANAGEVAQMDGVDDKWRPMEKRDVVGLASGRGLSGGSF